MCQICQKWAGKAPAEGRPNLASPSPNVRRDKISRSGEPLTLIYIYIYIYHRPPYTGIRVRGLNIKSGHFYINFVYLYINFGCKTCP